MAAIPKYLFIIRDSSGNLYEFQNATKKAWELYENDVGRCRFFIPHNDLKLSTTSVPDGGYSEILIYRNGELVWRGVTQIVQDVVDGVWVFGESLEATLGWYGVRYNQGYTTTNISTIITNEYTNIKERTGSFFATKLTQGSIDTPLISGTTNPLLITRTLFNENFLQFLKQMVLTSRAEISSTFAQNTTFEITTSETTPTFVFTRNKGEEKTDVMLELDSEIVDFNIPRDFREIANEVKGFAIAEGPTVLTSQKSDATSRASWYRREFYPFFNNVTAQTDLDQRTNNMLLENINPRRDMKIRLASGLVPFDGYSMGDSIRVRINRGRVNINEFRRVIGMEVNIGETGVEETVPLLEKARF